MHCIPPEVTGGTFSRDASEDEDRGLLDNWKVEGPRIPTAAVAILPRSAGVRCNLMDWGAEDTGVGGAEVPTRAELAMGAAMVTEADVAATKTVD